MASRRILTPLRLAVTLVTTVLLSGCVFAQHGGEVEREVRTALDDAELPAGVEAFNTTSGLGDSYSILICAEASYDLDPDGLARFMVDVFNTVRPIATDYSDHVDSVQLKVVERARDQDDLNGWCRDAGAPLFQAEEAGDLIPGVRSTYERQSIDVPYDVLTVDIPDGDE